MLSSPSSKAITTRSGDRVKTDSRAEEGTPRGIRELSWRTQTRLSHRFHTLRKRQLHHKKIKVSVARELCGFLGELGTRIEAGQESTVRS